MRTSNFEAFRYLFKLGESQARRDRESGELSLSITLDAENVSHNLEQIYNHTIQRVFEIGYQLEWGMSLEAKPEIVPDWHSEKRQPRKIGFDMFNVEEMPIELVKHYNTKFVESIRKSCLRDLSELFELYLNYVYECAVMVEHKSKPIKKHHVERADKYVWSGLAKKLKMLRQLGIKTLYHEPLLSLSYARNFYVHIDPILSPPTRASFEKEVIWCSHKIEFREQSTGKKVDILDMPDVYSGDDFPQVDLKFFDEQTKKSRMLDERGKLILTDADLSEICFFYIHCIGVYQQELIRFVNSRSIVTKPFDGYERRPQLSVGFLQVEEKKENSA